MWGRGGDHRREVTWCCWGTQTESSLHRPGVLGPRLPARRGLGSPRPPPGGAQAPPALAPRTPGSVCRLLRALRPLAEPPVLPGRLPPLPRGRLFLSQPRGTCRSRRRRSSAERPRYQTPAVAGPATRWPGGEGAEALSLLLQSPPARTASPHRPQGILFAQSQGCLCIGCEICLPAGGLALAPGPPPCDPNHYGSGPSAPTRLPAAGELASHLPVVPTSLGLCPRQAPSLQPYRPF